MLYGTFLSFGSTSNMLFKAYGFEDTQIALFGVCLLVSGVLGSVSYTIYIKKTIKYKNAIVCACVLSFIFIITNALLMNYVTEQKALISVMILGMGFNFVPMVPISYDLGC
jgi:MFS-type transporter involved in bile tolerance (Atg22 family)